jgi:hypothetical protein
VVVGQALTPGGVGGVDQVGSERPLLAVNAEELDRGLELGASETSIGVGTFLLGWPAAVAVGEGVGHPGEVVLDPFGVSGGGVGVKADEPSLDRDPGLAVPLELLAQGGVVELGVQAGHKRTGVTEKALDNVLGHSLVDQPGPEGVPELVRGYSDRTAGAVVQADAGLPVLERPAEHPVAVGLAGSRRDGNSKREPAGRVWLT